MTGALFLFGKLPAHGDFVSRGLAEDARLAWDDWASGALDALRGAATDFEAAHDAAPPWRFVAGPSPLGQGWRCGALAPSIDRAGRRYVIAAGVDGLDASCAAGLGLILAERVEALLYRALGETMTADAAIDALSEMLTALAEEAEAARVLGALPAGAGAWWSAGSGLPAHAVAAPLHDLLAAACALDLRSTAA